MLYDHQPFHTPNNSAIFDRDQRTNDLTIPRKRCTAGPWHGTCFLEELVSPLFLKSWSRPKIIFALAQFLRRPSAVLFQCASTRPSDSRDSLDFSFDLQRTFSQPISAFSDLRRHFVTFQFLRSAQFTRFGWFLQNVTITNQNLLLDRLSRRHFQEMSRRVIVNVTMILIKTQNKPS
jgi:hypothetical protein